MINKQSLFCPAAEDTIWSICPAHSPSSSKCPLQKTKLVHDHPLLPTGPRADTCPQGEPITPDLAANQVVRGATENFRQVCKGALDSTMPFQAGYWYQGPRESFQIIIKESTRENQKWENWGGEEGQQGGREVETDNRNRDGQPWICWFLSHQAQLYSLSCGSLTCPCSLPIKSTSLVQLVWVLPATPSIQTFQSIHPNSNHPNLLYISKPPPSQTSIQTFQTIHPNSNHSNLLYISKPPPSQLPWGKLLIPPLQDCTSPEDFLLSWKTLGFFMLPHFSVYW